MLFFAVGGLFYIRVRVFDLSVGVREFLTDDVNAKLRNGRSSLNPFRAIFWNRIFHLNGRDTRRI